MTSGLDFAYWQSWSWAFVERRSLLGSSWGSDPYRLFALLLPLFEFGPFPSCPHVSLTPCPSLLNHYSMCRICRLDEPNDRLFSCSPYISVLSLSMFSSTHIALIVVAEHSAQELNTLGHCWLCWTKRRPAIRIIHEVCNRVVHPCHNSQLLLQSPHLALHTKHIWVSQQDIMAHASQAFILDSHFVVPTNATWQLSPKTPCTWQHLRFTL